MGTSMSISFMTKAALLPNHIGPAPYLASTSSLDLTLLQTFNSPSAFIEINHYIPRRFK